MARSTAGADASAARRVIVKARLVKTSPQSAKAAALHLAYIERDGVERDGSKGVLYSAEGPANRSDFTEPLDGEKHQFRLIVSPEDAGELNLTDYVRRYMERVERDLGRKLEWAAVNHFDTDHPHAHIIVRGVDRDGREVRLDREYIANGLRQRAQELATEELGPRREGDVKRQQTHEVGQDRLTSLDKELARRAKDGLVDVTAPQRKRRPHIDEALLMARLEHLAKLRLVERTSPTTWALTAGWQDQLRELGMRGDIIKQMHRSLRGDPSRYRMVLPGQPLDIEGGNERTVVYGRVAQKGLSDELKGSYFAVIETPTGEGLHVPLDRRAAELLREGDLVAIGTTRRHNRPGPNRPSETGAKGNVGDAMAIKAPQQRSLSIQHATASPDVSNGPPVVHIGNNNDQRFGKVPATHNTEPPGPRRAGQDPMHSPLRFKREALQLHEQVQHRGAVWLDRVQREALAPYGFGAEVRRAIAQRDKVLRDWGIEPGDPSRARKLREVERRGVGDAVARASGQRFLAKAPKSFTGRLELVQRKAGQGAYAIVSDGKRFVVIPLTHDAKTREGMTVSVSCTPQGRFAVRTAGKDKERT